MKDIDQISRLVLEIADLLEQYDHRDWSNDLRIVASTSASMEDLKRRILKCYGGMGSLSDLNIAIENNIALEKEINEKYNTMSNELYRMVAT